MIIGTGLDLIEISRIEKVLDRNENHFLNKILTVAEKELCPEKPRRKLEFISGRFAGKEAVAKALGTGIGSSLKWKDIEILYLKSGKPYVNLKGLKWNSHELNIHISITHTKTLAAAKVIIERK